jgi:hypothetical protein
MSDSGLATAGGKAIAERHDAVVPGMWPGEEVAATSSSLAARGRPQPWAETSFARARAIYFTEEEADLCKTDAMTW